MRSKRSLEGILLIDHTASPGTPDVPEGQRFECGTLTCSHCQVQMPVNPLRTRARGYCPKCDHYVCDGCEGRRVASGGECLPWGARLDMVAERIEKGLPFKDLIP